MKFSFGKDVLLDKQQIINKSFLLTNKLGSYSNISIAGFPLYNDAGLLTIALNSPTERFSIISNCYEIVEINGKEYNLTTAFYVDDSKNLKGNQYLVKFEYEYFPKWVYLIDGILLEKTILLSETTNILAFKYRLIENTNQSNIKLKVIPALKFNKASNIVVDNQQFEVSDNKITCNDVSMYINSENKFDIRRIDYTIDDLICYGDKGNGRNSICVHKLINEYIFDIDKEMTFTFSINEVAQKKYNDIYNENIKLIQNRLSKLNSDDDFIKQLAYEGNKFIVNRNSVNASTIVAGYPFFADWGRDTMIAILGLAIASNDIENSKEILDTFAKYEQNGLLVNVFDLNGKDNMYNSVDAPLWFINAAYQLFIKTNDLNIYKRYWGCINNIITNYIAGTKYHIVMDVKDGLISAGAEKEQVTWMDVNVNGILPTPRHGKPVEINALWFNALNIYADICDKLKQNNPYQELINKVKNSMQKYWLEEGYLKDNISIIDDWHDKQVRCNQIWAIALPFIAYDKHQCLSIFNKVHKELYVGYGLRSLSNKDQEFKQIYQGDNVKRDLAYHQGTTWVFPLGGYFKAYLKLNNYSEHSKQVIKYQLDILKDALSEGCLGQLPEIYDGLNPKYSKGCFAQAWSVGEILRIAMEVQ